jgi:thioredoxin-like negative regulator of GroEL
MIRAFFAATLFAAPAIAADPIQWRNNYDAARKEATEKNLPLFVEVQTEQCVYCRKMEASTFVDPGIVSMANGNFIPLRIDGNKDRELAQALRVQLYPTVVIAGPDGKIHSFMQGYLSADQIRDPMKRVALSVSTPDWIARDLEAATKAISSSEYSKAVVLLNAIVKDGKAAPAVEKAKSALNEIESIAARKLVAARNREITGDVDGAADGLAELTKQFAGTHTAETATARLASLAGRPKASSLSARELLADARERFRTNQFGECLDACDKLIAYHNLTPEAADAKQLVASIQADPDRLAAVIDRQNERTATLYLTLADAWQKKGQIKEAQACLDKVTALCPEGKYAMAARKKLSELPGAPIATPASFKK